MVERILLVDPQQVPELRTTVRGKVGFGSTGLEEVGGQGSVVVLVMLLRIYVVSSATPLHVLAAGTWIPAGVAGHKMISSHFRTMICR